MALLVLVIAVVPSLAVMLIPVGIKGEGKGGEAAIVRAGASSDAPGGRGSQEKGVVTSWCPQCKLV